MLFWAAALFALDTILIIVVFYALTNRVRFVAGITANETGGLKLPALPSTLFDEMRSGVEGLEGPI